MSARLQWFRMYSEAVDDEKLRLLAFEDRWHFVALLCCKAQGFLDDESDLMRRKVAVKLGLQVRELEEVSRRLAEVGLIERETLQPCAWDKRQFVSDRDPTNSERQKRWREKQRVANSNESKRVSNALHNAPVTALETETETDIKSANALSSDATAPVDRCDGKACPHQEIIALYHETLPELKTVVASRWEGSKDATALRTRWREDKRHQSLTFWKQLFLTVRTNSHWMGQGQSGWRGADLRWLVKRENFDKACDLMVDNLRRELAHG